MSITNRAKAVAKNIEGKVQEGLANMTGDPKDKAEGKPSKLKAESDTL